MIAASCVSSYSCRFEYDATPFAQVIISRFLSELGVRCREYAEKHNGHFPSAWDELDFVGDDANWAKVLCCPQTHHEIGAWSAVNLKAEYRLLPGRSTNDPPDTILALEPLENHASMGANVLFVDGRTEWWPRSRLLEPRTQPTRPTAGNPLNK
jgi:prepilin-type processing-associated H-X9-DG protein